METVGEKLNDKINKHMSMTQKQIDRVSQEMNKRTRSLGADLAGHITQTENEAVAVRQDMGLLRAD
jgi:ferritin-like metal-binding protein YciE